MKINFRKILRRVSQVGPIVAGLVGLKKGTVVGKVLEGTEKLEKVLDTEEKTGD